MVVWWKGGSILWPSNWAGVIIITFIIHGGALKEGTDFFLSQGCLVIIHRNVNKFIFILNFNSCYNWNNVCAVDLALLEEEHAS